MKKIKYTLLTCALLAFGLTSCDETLSIKDNSVENKVQAPQIQSFYPLSGSAGTEITIKGSGFATADSVTINGVKTVIKNRISDSQILVELTGKETNGKLKVFNTKGNGESSASFLVNYLMPENIQIDLLGETVLTSGKPVQLKGKNFNGIEGVFLSGTSDREAKLIFKVDTVLIFEVPQTCDVTAKIKLSYYEKGVIKHWLSTDYTTGTVIIPPVVNACPAQAYLGQVIIVDMTNADRIDTVYYGANKVNFAVLPNNKLQVSLPKDLTQTTTAELWMTHNACERGTIKSNLKVIIPTNLYTLFDLKLSAQGGNGGSTGANAESAFFDAEAGGTYTTCDAVKHPNDIEFITYSNGSGAFVIYGPQALTAGTIKNFYCGTIGLDKSMDLVNFNKVEVKFKTLVSSDAAQSAIIDKFNKNEFDELSDATFTGISEPTAKNISYFKNATGTNNYIPGDIIWFKNFKTGKNGLMRVNSVNYSGALQDRLATAQFDILYQK